MFLLRTLLAIQVVAGNSVPAFPDRVIFRDDESPQQRDERMAWWRDAKFGMFVHWGLYAAAGGQWKGASFPDMRPGIEWLMCKGEPGGIGKDDYLEALAPRMTLDEFDPGAWASLAAEAGMKYFVITAKHHDGFGMVDFPYTDYDIADRTPYAADPMVPLSKAIREKGLRFGFYFSQSQDWSRPGGRPHWFKGLEGDWNDYVAKHAVPQLRHLLGGTYGRPDLLWFDSGNATKTQEGAALIWEELAAQPHILVNNRLKFGNRGDYGTPEQWVPPTVQADQPWETCMTMNGSWGYNPADPHWKSTDELIRNLCLVVSRGGNYLLNVGPRADGSLEPEAVERLKGIGDWMRVNGDAIYGARPNPLGHVRWGTATWKPGSDGCHLYGHLFDWPESGEVRLPLGGEVRGASWLGDEGVVTWSKVEDGVVLKLGRERPVHPAVSIFKLDLPHAEPKPLPLVVQPGTDGVIDLLAQEAACRGGVHLHHRDPRLDGWHGPNRVYREAQWTVSVPAQGGRYRVSAAYAFNTDRDPSAMRFVVSTGGRDAGIPVQVTGVETHHHNREHNQSLVAVVEAEGMLALAGGKNTILLKAEGAPERFVRPKGRANKKLCYSGFALLESLRLEPVL